MNISSFEPDTHSHSHSSICKKKSRIETPNCWLSINQFCSSAYVSNSPTIAIDIFTGRRFSLYTILVGLKKCLKIDSAHMRRMSRPHAIKATVHKTYVASVVCHSVLPPRPTDMHSPNQLHKSITRLRVQVSHAMHKRTWKCSKTRCD